MVFFYLRQNVKDLLMVLIIVMVLQKKSLVLTLVKQKKKKKNRLSLHYNGDNSYLFFNIKKIYKSEADNKNVKFVKWKLL